MFVEKRQFPRFNIRQMVKISNGIEEINDAVGLNISKSGILCETTKLINVDNQVYIVIVIPLDGNVCNIEIEGKVVRIEKNDENNRYMLGINFINIEENNRIILDNLLKEFSG